MISASEAKEKTDIKREELDQDILNSMLAEVERRILTAIEIGSYSLSLYFNTEKDLNCSTRLINELMSLGYKVEDFRYTNYVGYSDYSDEPYIYIDWFC